ncbi:MAG: YkgJ family cysteine cluster protein [Chlorobiales bacterium]|nr:YkgJ family cysteine cluster protein [Chlorobiales bacterium]
MIPIQRKKLNRETPFSFSCGRCLRCCHLKKIQINPYEVARLARNRGLSTTEFIQRYTTTGGTVLKFDDNDMCPFLNEQGCSVHKDRPLVCRLYPLGRHVFDTGEEHFSEVEPHRECKGVYGKGGKVQSYLEEQGAIAFMEGADVYLNLLWKLLKVLEDETADLEKQNVILETVLNFSNEESEQQSPLVDMDAAIEAYCKEHGQPVPEDLQLKMVLHVQIIEGLISKN